MKYSKAINRSTAFIGSLTFFSVVTATVLASISQARSVGGNDKGNGGDVVMCGTHLRVLDSVMMKTNGPFAIRNFSNSKVASESIRDHLLMTTPAMGQSLTAFLEVYSKKVDLRRGVAWISGVPKELKDENLHVEVPSECRPKPIQAIVRVAGAPLRFYFNSEILTALEKNSDELSWILIHEWLREFQDDADVIRILNGYLHSEEFFKANEREALDHLIKMGIPPTETGKTASEVQKSELKMIQILGLLEPLMAEARLLKSSAKEAAKEGSADKETARRNNRLYDIYRAKEELLEKLMMARESGLSDETYRRYVRVLDENAELFRSF